MVEPSLLSILRVWLAGIFLFAGIMKVVRPGTARSYVARRLSVPISSARVVIALVSLFEASIAVGLLWGVWLKLVCLGAAASLGVFTAVILLDRDDADCGCFGTSGDRGDPNVLTLARNSLMAGVALYVALEGGAEPVTDPTAFALAGAFLVSSVGCYIVVRAFLDPLPEVE